MLRVFEAVEYLREADRGINFPVMVRGLTENREEATIFVKTRVGYGNRPAAPGVELFTTLLARQMGLRAPEPVLVGIPKGFEKFIHNAPKHHEVVKQSVGINFGTVALGNDWKTWPVVFSTRSFPNELIENILAFDALAQHTDREPNNPNMMWRHGEIAILDHEKCFGYLSTAKDAKRPWRDFLALRPFQNHSLGAVGKALSGPGFAKSIREKLAEKEMMKGIERIITTTEGAFPEATDELSRIKLYCNLVSNNTADFFNYLRHSIER